MSTIVLNAPAVDAAGVCVGVKDREALTEHLGFDHSQPLTLMMVATILTALPVSLNTAFRIG